MVMLLLIVAGCWLTGSLLVFAALTLVVRRTTRVVAGRRVFRIGEAASELR